ncbi:MAG: PIN domain-containing protein [Candidatus Aenigmarchaeota archaeon]|nr:PIN domain-containing protein [Candidatus Aenigmarchaeota archaeon]
MTDYIVDAWAWIEYFDGSRAGNKIRDYIESGRNAIFISSVTFAEVISKFLRTGRDADVAIEGIRALSRIINADEELAASAGRLHAGNRNNIKNFGLADAFVLASARKTGCRILTGDPHFEGFKEAVMITR